MVGTRLWTCGLITVRLFEAFVVAFGCWQNSGVKSSVPDAENGIITPNDTEVPPVVTPPTGPLHPNLVWPTASGITEEKARRICELPIRRSPAYNVCSDIAEQSMDVITESCMLDLLVYVVYAHVQLFPFSAYGYIERAEFTLRELFLFRIQQLLAAEEFLLGLVFFL